MPWNPLPPPPNISGQNIWIGTSGYYYDDWQERFYPPKRAESEHDRLRYYQKYFSFVEINTTFYREPVPQFFLDIEKRSKPGMMYSVKVFRDISHSSEFDTGKGRSLMENQVAAAAPLIETGRFYSFLIQLEDHVQRKQSTLDYLLAVSQTAIKRHADVHIEFRHNSWHQEHVLQSMKDAGVGICNTEIPPVAHAFPLKAYATSDKGYIRYSGRNTDTWYQGKKAVNAKERLAQRNARYDYLYSDAEIKDRAEGLITLHRKTNTVAGAFNNHYLAKAVINALQMIDLLDKRLRGVLP